MAMYRYKNSLEWNSYEEYWKERILLKRDYSTTKYRILIDFIDLRLTTYNIRLIIYIYCYYNYALITIKFHCVKAIKTIRF